MFLLILGITSLKNHAMGKGDKKTRRGKISMGSFGVRRTKKEKKPLNKTVTAAKEIKEPDTPPPVKADKTAQPKAETKPKKQPEKASAKKT